MVRIPVDSLFLLQSRKRLYLNLGNGMIPQCVQKGANVSGSLGYNPGLFSIETQEKKCCLWWPPRNSWLRMGKWKCVCCLSNPSLNHWGNIVVILFIVSYHIILLLDVKIDPNSSYGDVMWTPNCLPDPPISLSIMQHNIAQLIAQQILSFLFAIVLYLSPWPPPHRGGWDCWLAGAWLNGIIWLAAEALEPPPQGVNQSGQPGQCSLYSYSVSILV